MDADKTSVLESAFIGVHLRPTIFGGCFSILLGANLTVDGGTNA
jgi:hypothetical protein